MINNNILLNIKYVFLHFLQALFSNDHIYTWDPDVQKTNIIIADRHAIDIGVAVFRPSIILQRGDVSWTYSVRGQDATNALINYNDKNLQSVGNKGYLNKAYTDLLRGQIVFNIVSKNGIQAEIIAEKVFKNLTGYKDELRKAGIKLINNLSISQEQIIKNSSEIDLVGIQIYLGFIQQLYIVKDEKNYNAYLYINDTEIFENHDYTIIDNGTKIKLREVKEGILKLDYIDTLTLESRIGVELLSTTDPLIYLIPNSGSILGYYKIFMKAVVNPITT